MQRKKEERERIENCGAFFGVYVIHRGSPHHMFKECAPPLE
jgi:hypothetical protein